MLNTLETYMKSVNDSIIEDLERCADCPLLGSRFVPGEGSHERGIMIVGEAPGEQEDAEGRPFVGKSGALLRGFLEALNMDIMDIYITNVVKRRPTTDSGSNRKPTRRECYRCGCHLAKEIVEKRPVHVLALGSVPTEFFLGPQYPVTKYRGTSSERKNFDVKYTIYPTYHPSYVLRSGGVMTTTGNDWVTDLENFKKFAWQ